MRFDPIVVTASGLSSSLTVEKGLKYSQTLHVWTIYSTLGWFQESMGRHILHTWSVWDIKPPRGHSPHDTFAIGSAGCWASALGTARYGEGGADVGPSRGRSDVHHAALDACGHPWQVPLERGKSGTTWVQQRFNWSVFCSIHFGIHISQVRYDWTLQGFFL